MSKTFPAHRRFLKEMRAAYEELKKDYGPEFDAKMAETMIEVVNVQYSSDRPGGISVLEAAMVMTIAGPADEAPEKTAALRKHILAAVVWNQEEQDNIGNTVRP